MSIQDDELFQPGGTAVIREVYDNDNAHEMFAEQLERALEASVQIIIIEPPRLSDETARWIAVGNCLHKTAVVAGLTSIACCFGWPENPYVYTPQVIISLCCTTLYTISWQFDPCVKYQVFADSKRLSNLPLLSTLSSTSPVVLMRQDDTRRKLLHCSVTLVATALIARKLFKLFN